MASLTTKAASPFPLLLKRSKFASYDPAIVQVYSSSDGDSHRGDFGFKYPLPVRRRRAFVTVRAVDTLQKRAEWDPAQEQATWIRKFQEVAGSVRPGERQGFESSGTMDLWNDQLGHAAHLSHNQLVDSEFEHGTSAGDEAYLQDGADLVRRKVARRNELKRGAKLAPGRPWMENPGPNGHIPNLAAMNDDRFERHLESVRALRPAFRRWLQDRHQNKAVGSNALDTMYAHPNEHNQFIAQRAAAKRDKLSSRLIEKQPHVNGGLCYTDSTMLEDVLHRPAYPGRVLQQEFGGRGGGGSYTTAFAGMTPMLPRSQTKEPQRVTTDFGSGNPSGLREHRERGVLPMRLYRDKEHAPAVILKRTPIVVGRNTVMRAHFDAKVTPWQGVEMHRENAHAPGSAAYCGAPETNSNRWLSDEDASMDGTRREHVQPVPMMMHTEPPALSFDAAKGEKESGAKLIGSLQSIISKTRH